MKKFEIRFESFWGWCEFWSLVSSRTIKSSFHKYSLICLCTESEIELAIHALKGRVIELKP